MIEIFEDFRKDWLSKHRSSIPSKAKIGSSLNALLTWFLTFFGAATFSAAHTIPTLYYLLPESIPSPMRWVVATCGFFATDLLIYLTAFFKDKGKIVRATQLLALTVAIMANTYSELQIAKTGFEQFIAIVFGSIFPLIVYCAGEMSNRSIKERNEKLEQAEYIYKEKMQELETKILTAYNKQNKISMKFQEISDEKNSEDEISQEKSEISIGPKAAWNFFIENTDEIEKFQTSKNYRREIGEKFQLSPVQRTRLKDRIDKLGSDKVQ